MVALDKNSQRKFIITRELTDYKLTDNINKNNSDIKKINDVIATYALAIVGTYDNFNKTHFIESLNKIKNIRNADFEQNSVEAEAHNNLKSIFESSEYDVIMIDNECHITNKTPVNI